MNSVKIGTYQMDTSFGLYLPEYTIPAPTPQTHFVQIIGRDGSVDLSEAIGLHYDSRVWDLDFKCFDPTVNWHTLTSQVMNAIHGKRLNFEFDDDPNYFWTGRISVSSYVSTRGTGTLKVNITSDPFKYAKLSTIVTKNASTGTDYTGALVSFNTANAKINDLSVTMQPIQNLNGYSNPWPGGGGINKLNVSVGTVGSEYYYNKSAGTTLVGNGSAATITGTNPVAITNTSNYRGGLFFSDVLENGKTYALRYRITGENTANIKRTVYLVDSDNVVVSNLSHSSSVAQSVDYVYVIYITPTADNLRAVFAVESSTPQTITIYDMGLNDPDTDTAFYPYANICPISGKTGLNVYVSPTQDPDDATVYNVDWTTQAGTVYGGTLDVVTGVLTSTMANIASYNGETITEPWLSSMDAYASGATPTTGAQVVYTLSTPLTYQLTPNEVATLVGQNNVWSDSGDVSVTVVTPETVTNNGLAVVPTLTASADMVLKWGNYSASVQQGTSTVPQLILENGANLIYIIGTGTLSFTWQEASL